ncbi:MAG: DUF5916 domain-containing protein, partial [Gammaproteobacteria bacterium]|nr:DUF5916 domain-containing protein [Gammaproteobacteria bacterium]
GIWHNAAKVNASGYVVEMAIPFSTLRFPASEGGQPRKWKFELLRFLPRSVKHRIANTPVDRNNPCKFCQFDSLVGFTDLQASTNLQITPTLVLDKIDTRPDPVIDNWQSHDTASSAGLDIRWGITQDSVLNATINPDFSQVEADDVELDINNPYSIRYQEKRPFFTEGEEYFSTHNPLVHTRDMIEPDYGLKLTGQNNGHSYGVFFVKDKHTSFLIPGNLGSKLVVQENVESENQVVRYSRDLGNKNNIGFLVTDRQGEDYSNQVKSVDTVYWLGQNNSLTFQYMVSDSVYSDVVLAEYIEPNRNPATYDYVKEKYLSDDAYILRFMHDSRNWVGYFFNGRTGKDFRADLGFKDKADYDKKVIGFGRRFYSESKDSWLSDFYLGADWDLAVDIDGRELERESEIKFRAKGLYQSTYDAELKSRETYYDGDVSDGIDGEYFNENSFTLRVGFEPVQGINVNFRAEIKDAIDYANFRQGESVNNSIQFKWQIGQGLNTQIDFKDVDFDVAQGHLFDAQATNVKLTYHFNVKSFMRLTMQNLSIHKNQSLYIDPVDSKYESKGNQFLYSYRVNPQTLIYAGYSDVGYQDDQLTQFARTGKRLFMKFSYAWNA